MAGFRTLDPSTLTITELTYNSFQFPESTNVRLSGKNIYNKADNAVKYTTYTMTVEAIIYMTDVDTPGNTLPDDDDADETLGSLRKTLNAPGKDLAFQNAGFGIFGQGNYLINSYTTVDQSPKPRVMMMENLGGGKSVHLVWEVEFSLAECKLSQDGTDSFDLANDIIEFCYSKEWQISERGRSKHVYTFYIEAAAPIIVSSRKHDSQNVYETMVKNRLLGTVAYPPNAKMSFGYTMSENQREMTATLTYTEIDTDDIYPPGIEHIEMQHESESSLEEGAFVRWNNRINGTIRTYPGYHKDYAWQVFLAVFRDRFERGIQTSRDSRSGQRTVNRLYVPYIKRIRLVDHLFSNNNVQFEIEYIVDINSINDLLQKTGLFRAYRKNSWTEWSSYYNPSAAGAVLSTEQGKHKAAVVDPCNRPVSLRQEIPVYSPNQIPYLSLSQPSCPDQQDSWQDYQVKVRVVSDRPIRKHKRYQQVTKKSSSSQFGGKNYETTLDHQTEVSDKNNEKYQLLSGTSQVVEMRGYAIRYNGPTPVPSLKTVGGKELELFYEDHGTQQITSSRCPKFLTTWIKQYYVIGTIENTVNVPYTIDVAVSPGDYQRV